MAKDKGAARVGLSRSDRIFNVVNYIVLTLLMLIVLLPLMNVVSSSISDPNAVSAGKVWFLPVGFSTAAYQQIFN